MGRNAALLVTMGVHSISVPHPQEIPKECQHSTDDSRLDTFMDKAPRHTPVWDESLEMPRLVS
jgi:hypothetical protein